MKKSVSLIMWSGGLDSTYLLYKLLQDGHNVHAHHVIYQNLCQRAVPELNAVNKLRESFYKHGFIYNYSESIIDFSKVENCGGGDRDMVLFAAQRVCYSLKGNVKVYLGWTADDLSRQSVMQRSKLKLTEKLWDSLVFSMYPDNTRISTTLERPLSRTLKKDIIALTPKWLSRDTWSCRFPVFLNEKSYTECGKCLPCRSDINR